MCDLIFVQYSYYIYITMFIYVDCLYMFYMYKPLHPPPPKAYL